MSQLKFIRSKSTSRSNPLGRLKQQLKQIQKPGKLHVSVGRSRQSSQPNEELPISTPKNKMNLKLQQLYEINENIVPLQKSVEWQSLLPLSHDNKILNKQSNSFYNNNNNNDEHNIQNKQYQQYTQTNFCSPKLSESSNTNKVDPFQFRSTKLNSSIKLSSSNCDIHTTSKFNFNQFALKQSQFYNIDTKQQYNLTHSNNNIKLKNDNYEQLQISQKNDKFESIILDIYPMSSKNKQQQIKTKPIIEQNEDEEFQGIKFSTQTSEKQIPKFYSEILTDRSLFLNLPKKFKETEIQTIQPSNLNLSCKSTTNASVQTKSKKKKLGLFQYQLSYLSPKANRNFLESDQLSLDDLQQQIIYETQPEDNNKIKNQQLKEIDLNNNKSQVFNQNSNLYLTKQLLLDPEEDNQPFYLQAEPKEINSNLYDKKSNNSKEFTHKSCTNNSKSKIEKSTSFYSLNCYKDHLQILINQNSQNHQNHCKTDQNQPYIIQDNKIKKQRYPLRTSQKNQCVQQQKTKQTKNK